LPVPVKPSTAAAPPKETLLAGSELAEALFNRRLRTMYDWASATLMERRLPQT
jgi:hypothetical protein